MTIRNLVDTGVSPGRRFQFLFIGLGAGHLGTYSTMFHPAIPAYHQVLHLRISLRIHLRCRSRLRRRVPRPYSFHQRSITTDSGMMQVGGYRPQFRPHRKAVFEVRYTQARYTAQWWRPTDRARPADCLPIQPALRRAGDRAVNDRLSWCWLFNESACFYRGRLPVSSLSTVEGKPYASTSTVETRNVVMAEYMVRVELLKAGWDDYEDLHVGMESLGLKKTITFSDGSLRKLPIGTYYGPSSLDITSLREKIKALAIPLSSAAGPWIFVSQSETWSAWLDLA